MKPEQRRRHGRRALKAVVRLRGVNALDLRHAGAQALAVWRREMIDHLGGQDAVSVPQRLMVEKVISTELLIQDADLHLLAMRSTVTRQHRYVGLVRERQTLIDSQARLLSMLGLDQTARSRCGPSMSYGFTCAEPRGHAQDDWRTGSARCR
jgi:hypothetical protein